MLLMPVFQPQLNIYIMYVTYAASIWLIKRICKRACSFFYNQLYLEIFLIFSNNMYSLRFYPGRLVMYYLTAQTAINRTDLISAPGLGSYIKRILAVLFQYRRKNYSIFFSSPPLYFSVLLSVGEYIYKYSRRRKNSIFILIPNFSSIIWQE